MSIKCLGGYFLLSVLVSCGSIGVEHLSDDRNSDSNMETDLDTNMDVDTDSDTDSDSDTDIDTDADGDTDTDLNMDSDTDLDTNTEADTGTDTNTDWAPTDLSGLVLWLNADDSSSIMSDTGVSEWRDQSGNSRHAIQSSQGLMPALISNEFGTLPGIAFDGVDDFLRIDSYTPLVDYDVFVIWKSPVSPSTDTINTILRYGEEQFNTNMEITYGHAQEEFRNAATFSMGGEYLVARFDFPFVDSAYLWEMSFDSILGRLISRTDGHLSNQFGDLPGTPDYAGSGLGIGCRVDGTYPFNGIFGEIIVYDYVLDEVGRAAVESYLKAKWGTAG